MRFRRAPYLTRVLLAGALLAPVLLAACSIRNPFGSSDSEYAAPVRMGRGDCSAQLINLSGRSLEVYFFLGLQNPPRNRAAWPRLGVLEPLSASVIYADCEFNRIRVRAYACRSGPEFTLLRPKLGGQSTDIASSTGSAVQRRNSGHYWRTC